MANASSGNWLKNGEVEHQSPNFSYRRGGGFDGDSLYRFDGAIFQVYPRIPSFRALYLEANTET